MAVAGLQPWILPGQGCRDLTAADACCADIVQVLVLTRNEDGVYAPKKLIP